MITHASTQYRESRHIHYTAYSETNGHTLAAWTFSTTHSQHASVLTSVTLARLEADQVWISRTLSESHA